MLHIILFLLKILGCILLIILSLILILLLVVLFVPIRYDVSGKYYGTPEFLGKITWLFGAISATSDFKDKKLSVRVKFLWKTFIDTEKEKDTKSEDQLSDSEISDDERTMEIYESESEESLKNTGELEQTQLEDKVPNELLESSKILDEQAVNKSRRTDEKQHKKMSTTKKTFVEKIFNWIDSLFDRIDSFFENTEEKIDAFSCKIHKIEKFIYAECTQNSLKFLKKMLVSICKHIAPYHVRGKVHFGMDKPSMTGKILGYASAFYPLYGESVQLIPDFDQQVVEGELTIKGSIQLYIFIVWALKALLCKDIRKLIKYIKHLKK